MEKAVALVRARFARSEYELVGYDVERRQLVELITRLVSCAESNSVLILGGRGSGKRHFVRSALEHAYLREPKLRALLKVVRLCGLLQTDDKLALRAIARQLGLDKQLSIEEGGAVVESSFSEQLRCLLRVLHGGATKDATGVCLLFLLENFDLFAQHKNQTLLYNLFDVAQARALPVCVVGMTTRLDALEQLEKRVKSRFSHRQIQLCPSASFEQYLIACKRLLTMSLSDAAAHACPQSVKEALRAWNKSVEDWLHDSDCTQILRENHALSHDVGHLKLLLAWPLAAVSTKKGAKQCLDSADLVDAFLLLNADSKGNVIRGLSIFELTLLMAMVHLHEAYDGEALNFEMIYSEYVRFCAQRGCAGSNAAHSKAVAQKAFEQLLACELVVPVSGAININMLRTFRPVLCLIEREQLLTYLRSSVIACPTDLLQWASTQRVLT